MEKGIKKIADFLGVDLTIEQLKELTRHFSFENYKKVTNGKNFFNDKFEHVRKGKAGGWKKEFPAELNQRSDQLIHEKLQKLNMKCEDSYEFLN